MDEFGLEHIFASVDKVISATAATADGAPESRERAALEAVLARLRSIRAKAPEALQLHLASLKSQAEGVRDEAARLKPELDAAKVRLDAARAEIDRARAQAATGLVSPSQEVPAAPLPPIDLELGSQLRTEVLSRYLPEAEAARPYVPGKDIWEDWK